MKCPACLAHSIDVAFQPVGFACPLCESVFTMVEEQPDQWLPIDAPPNEAGEKPPIPLGARASIQGTEYTVKGVATRYHWNSPDDREPYFEPYKVHRYEYILESPQAGACVLSWDSEQWWLAKPVDSAQATSHEAQHYHLHGRAYRHRSTATPNIVYAAGFFPFPVSRGSTHIRTVDFVSESRVLTVRTDPRITASPWKLIHEGQPCGADEVAEAFGLDPKKWKSVTWRPLPPSRQPVVHQPRQAWQKWAALPLALAGLGVLSLLRQPPAAIAAEGTVICPVRFLSKVPKETRVLSFETTVDAGSIRFETDMKQGAINFNIVLSGDGSGREITSIDQSNRFIVKRGQPTRRLNWKPGLLPAGRHRLEVRCDAVVTLQPEQPLRIIVFDGQVPRPTWPGLVSALLLSAATWLLLWRRPVE